MLKLLNTFVNQSIFVSEASCFAISLNKRSLLFIKIVDGLTLKKILTIQINKNKIYKKSIDIK